MKINSKNIPPDAVPISRAWLEFADYPEEFGDRGRRFQEIVQAAALRPEIDEKSPRHPVNIQADKLQCELLRQIRGGTFEVWGRDGIKGLTSPHVELPNNYFDECRDFFKADWAGDVIDIHGQRFFDVHVAPALGSQTQTSDDFKKIGRPSGQGIEEAIAALDQRDTGFKNLARITQCNLVRIEIFGPNINQVHPPKNYADGAIKKRLRAYFEGTKS